MSGGGLLWQPVQLLEERLEPRRGEDYLNLAGMRVEVIERVRDAPQPEGERSWRRHEHLFAHTELVLARQHRVALVFPAVSVQWGTASGLSFLVLDGAGPARVCVHHQGGHGIAQEAQGLACAGWYNSRD
jgi:hypothetical protein